MRDKHFFIAAAVFVLIGLVSFSSFLNIKKDEANEAKVDNFPRTIDGWTSRDIPLSEEDYQILETKNLFVRQYTNPAGESVYLYIIYSQDNRKVSHPPEICLMGSGMTITKKSKMKIKDSIPAIKLIAQKANLPQLYVYWFKAGDLYTENYLRQQVKIVLDRMIGRRTAGAMIRVSAAINKGNLKQATDLVNSFCLVIEPYLHKYVP